MAEISDELLEQKLKELSAKADEFNSKLFCKFPVSRDGLFPTFAWTARYRFPPGRTDCIIFSFESCRVSVITPCAKKVLDAFNSENSTDYELDKCLDVCASASHGVPFHCNFTAKPKTRPYVADDYSAKTFFAEVQLDSNREKVPTRYSILHGINTKLGCEMCPDMIAHPTSGPHEELLFRVCSPHFVRI